MSVAPRLDIDCPAKVNLALSVGPPGPGGLHPLASWMVVVVWADTLRLTRLNAGPSRFIITGPCTDGGAMSGGAPAESHHAQPAAVPVVVDWPTEKDLVYRAHRLMERHTGLRLSVDLKLRKSIPAGAGLAGGSSDAAATLVGLNRLFGLGIDAKTLKQLGLELGSDIVFMIDALLGCTSALVSGFGEHVEPVQLEGVIHLVLIFPGFGCPTGEVYRAFDQLHGGRRSRPADVERVRGLASRQPLDAAGFFNDLAEPAWTVRPPLKVIHDQLNRELGVPVHVTGSGSTLFTLAPTAGACDDLARRIRVTTGLPAVATRTCPPIEVTTADDAWRNGSPAV